MRSLLISEAKGKKISEKSGKPDPTSLPNPRALVNTNSNTILKIKSSIPVPCPLYPEGARPYITFPLFLSIEQALFGT